MKKIVTLKVLVTGGPTREYLDDIRFISNLSTGELAYDICKRFCSSPKTKVFLVTGPNPQPFNKLALKKHFHVETAKEMLQKVIAICKRYKPQFLISTAAVADFTPVKKRLGKVSFKNSWIIKLKPTLKILDEVNKKFPQIKKIAFKLEPSKKKIKNLDKFAKNYMKRKNLELLCVNFLSDIKKSYKAYVYIKNRKPLIVSSKEELAKTIFVLVQNM